MNELIKNAVKVAPISGAYVLAINPPAAVAVCTLAVVAGVIVWRHGYPRQSEAQ